MPLDLFLFQRGWQITTICAVCSTTSNPLCLPDLTFYTRGLFSKDPWPVTFVLTELETSGTIHTTVLTLSQLTSICLEPLKQHLGGRPFHDNEEVEMAANAEARFLLRQNVVPRQEKCIDVPGNRAEK
jgi:hypothetical protein